MLYMYIGYVMSMYVHQSIYHESKIIERGLYNTIQCHCMLDVCMYVCDNYTRHIVMFLPKLFKLKII